MKVRKMLLREEIEKVLHTKSNGDKLVVAASGDGYTAFTKDNVLIGHISAETDAAAVAEFSKKEPKYEALDMSQDELRITAERYLDFEIGELMTELLEKTSTMSREQLSRLVRLCRNFYALLEEFAATELDEGYMDTHEGVAHVDTLDLMAALKSVVREYGHMELVTPLYCELHDDEHGRRLELNRAVDEGMVPDMGGMLMPGMPERIGGDVNINLDGSHSSVGFLGGTANNTNNGAEGDHDMRNERQLDEAMSKSALSGIFGTLGETYGKIMLNSEQADKILTACGQEPQGKDATFDEVLSVVQDVIAGAPLAATAIVALLEAVFDVLLALATAGLIVIPVDGPVGECITAILAAIPVAAIVGAIVGIPAALANRLVLLARKALRNKKDVEEVEQAAQTAGVKNDSFDDELDESLYGLAGLAAPMAASAMTPKTSRGNFAGNTINFNFSGNNARIDPHTDFSGNSNDMSGNSASVDAKVAEVSPEIGADVAAEVNPEIGVAAEVNPEIGVDAEVNPDVSATVPLDVGVDGASVGFLGGTGGMGGAVSDSETNDVKTEDLEDDFMDAENMDMSEFDSPTGKLEDIEFVMTEYIADSMLIEFVKKVDATTWLVGVEDEVVTVKFDPSWSEYVYTIEGKGPYSHRSYEYISRDVYDFVMANRTDNSADLDEDYGNDEMTEFLNWIQDYKGGCLWDAFTTEFNTDEDPDIDDVLNWLEDFNNDAYYAYIEKDEYDDDFDDLSSFRECSEVKKADALYGVKERGELVEAVYTDTHGIMGVAGETYTTAELRKIWNDNHNDDPSMAQYKGDYDKWISDTLAQMSRNDDVDEAFDMTYGPDLDKLSWQVASYLDVDALGEDNWIEFDCEEPRGLMGSKEKTMRFQAIGENAHKHGYLKTAGSKVEVHFRNGSEAVCNSAEEIARFIAGEFGISL